MAKNKIAKLESKTTAPKPAPAPAVVNPMATLTLLRVRPNSATYGIPGIPGTLRVAKSLLAVDTAPSRLAMVNGGLFRAPDPERAAKMAARAERRVQIQVSREERAMKAMERARKLQERAAKAALRAEKLAAKLQPKPEAPAQA
jgi:hypothetical protein